MKKYLALAVLITAAVLSSCGGSTSDAADTPAPSSTAAPTTTAPTVNCVPYEDLAIMFTLTGGATTIDQAFLGEAADGTLLVIANIYAEDGTRLSSSDVWAMVDGIPHAVTSSAQDYSATPPAKQYVTENVIEAVSKGCVIPASRAS